MNKHQAILDRRVLRILAVTLLAAACTDGGAPTAPDSFGVQPTVTNVYEAGSGEQFAFLQPLVKGKASGPLATGLSPIVKVCNIETPDVCLALEADEEDDHYHANWRDRTAQPDETYVITVETSFGFVLGSLELILDGRSGDKAGRTFPIKFWIGDGLGDVVATTEDCVGDDRCNADDVSEDEGDIVITTENEGGATMAQLTFPEESVPEGGLAVILDCREGGFDAGDGPLPTALDQWPLFCNITAFNADGSPFIGALPNPAELDICVVDEDEEGQDPYHGFVDVHDLVIGKSDGPGDFTFLEHRESTFELNDCAGNTTTIPEFGFGEGILRELDTRLAPVFSLFMPEELRAAPMWFRDGGVGGLITSFSDVNPVEPAYISGTVSNFGGGLEGVTVTLSGAASDEVLSDEGGAYEFGPLQAAPGGSSYTVTVSDLPEGEIVVDPDQDVNVEGSGTTVVDFEATVFFYEGTGNYYQAFSTPLSWDAANAAVQGLPSFESCSPQLASILSPGEDEFIVDRMPQAAQAGLPGSGGDGGYWLGGLQPTDGEDYAEAGGGWMWQTDGDIPEDNSGQYGYANWAFGEPNNQGGGTGEGATNTEDRLHFLGDWSNDPAEKVKWNDEPGSRAYGYVVEYVCPTIG